jgi:hypothetical protein
MYTCVYIYTNFDIYIYTKINRNTEHLYLYVHIYILTKYKSVYKHINTCIYIQM